MIAIALVLIATAGGWEQAQLEAETTCLGKADKVLQTPESWTAAGFGFTVRGAVAEVKREAREPNAQKGAGAKLGVLMAIKDFSPETRSNLETFLAAFKKAGVEGIVADGDSAYGVDDQDGTLTDLFGFLGAQGVPVYAVIGNSESRSSFNRGLLAAWRKTKTVINLNLVRRVDGDGFSLVSMPGYYDRRFIAETSGCDYKPEDLHDLARLAKDATGPVVLVSHGPPQQEGKGALDATSDGKNVGDPAMAQAIADGKINFGVFGHILEAGGRATDLEGKRLIKPGVAAASLYLNPGPASAEPWLMNEGGVSRGMAAILTLRGGKAEWQQVLAAPLQRAPKGRKPAAGGKPAGAK
jgi:Icc-related predicted phosphoesterase